MFEKTDRPLIPENIRNLSPYQAGKTIAEVQELFNPPRISKLASNENRLGCSPKVKKAVLDAFSEIQDYPDPIARKLRHRIAEKNGVKPGNIILAAGSESVISILCRTFFLDHENAITADATFVGFFVQANVRGIDLIRVPVTKEYRFDLDSMLASIDENTKMVYIANPNNPTGTYIAKKEFTEFMDRVPSEVLVIMDEAYFEYTRDVDDYPDSMDYKYDNVITLRTFSKAFGLAGFRIGYGIAHEELIGTMLKTKLTFEPATLAQAAALAAYDDEDFLKRSIKLVVDGRRRLYSFFREQNITCVPSISNSVMMVLPSEQEAVSFTRAMLEEGVILRRTNAFGLPNCVRITIGTEEEMNHFEQSFEKVFVS